MAINSNLKDVERYLHGINKVFSNENQWTLLAGNTPTAPTKGTSNFKFWYRINRDQKRIDYLFWVRFSEDIGNTLNDKGFDPVLVDLSSIINKIESINGFYLNLLYPKSGLIMDNLSFSGSKIIEKATTGGYRNEPLISVPKSGEDTCYLTYS